MSFLQKIKQAFSSNPGDDSDNYPRGEVGYNKKVSSFVRILPYGLSSLEPQGSFVLLFNNQGQESNKLGIPSAMMDRLKNLSQGEVAIYNSITGHYVYIKADGSIELNTDTKIDGDLQVTGNVQIDGNLNVDGNTTMTGTLGVTGTATLGVLNCTSATINGISFSSHVHTSVTTGTSNTGGPV